jgi:monothiol glutaredoxin
LFELHVPAPAPDRQSRLKPEMAWGLRPEATGSMPGTMKRPVLQEARVHPTIREKIATYRSASVEQVQAALAQHDVVVVGMSQNPFPRRARKLLTEKGILHHYLGYGSYLSNWRVRLPLKMWTGWPTFPMIFVKGTLIGGYQDLVRLFENGQFQALLDAPRETGVAAE